MNKGGTKSRANLALLKNSLVQPETPPINTTKSLIAWMPTPPTHVIQVTEELATENANVALLELLEHVTVVYFVQRGTTIRTPGKHTVKNAGRWVRVLSSVQPRQKRLPSRVSIL